MLRDYQQEMLDRLHEAWKTFQGVMVQMPTGTGKTHLMAAVIRENMADGVLIVAHRMELIGQISQTLDAFGVPHGFIDRWTKDADKITAEHRVVVASIQTLSRRIQTTNFEPKVIIVDEAHHAVAKTYRLLWDKWPEAKFLGLTATPCRLNQTGFTDLFDKLLESYPIQTFIDRGWLADFEYVSVTPDNWMVERIAGLKKRGVDGDYQTKEMVRKDGKYLLRKSTPYQRKPVSKWTIWYNRAILWMEDVLVVKKTGEVFPVKAYGSECFYVASHDEKRGRFIRVELNGDMAFADFLNIWQDVYEIPQWGSQKLIRASSGQMEYLDEEYKRKVKIVSL